MDAPLREQVMINQFVLAAGCAREQAKQILQSAHWQFETALSIFFQDAALPTCPPGASAHFGQIDKLCMNYMDDLTYKANLRDFSIIEHPLIPKMKVAFKWGDTRSLLSFKMFELGAVCATGHNLKMCPPVNRNQHRIMALAQLVMTPCNTPATPPNFPDTLLAFSKLSTGNGNSPASNNNNGTPQARQSPQPAAATQQR